MGRCGIYNSRNYKGLLIFGENQKPTSIYNSRNYKGLLILNENVSGFSSSTTVEIIRDY